MLTGTCPKCASGEIYRAPAQGLQAKDNTVKLSHVDRTGWTERSAIHVYMCRACGYLEMYAALDDENFARLDHDTNWTHV